MTVVSSDRFNGLSETVKLWMTVKSGREEFNRSSGTFEINGDRSTQHRGEDIMGLGHAVFPVDTDTEGRQCTGL